MPKMAGKQFLGKVVIRFFIYPAGQKFCQTRSISHHFQDNRIFVFHAEIQHGR